MNLVALVMVGAGLTLATKPVADRIVEYIYNRKDKP